MEESKNLIPFEGKPIRKVWYNDEWYFSIVDVIDVLTGSSQPSRYWTDLKKRAKKEENQSFDFCERLKFKATDGKSYKQDAANTKGILRIVMSVSSPKVEPLKMWLAEVGTERIQETENPEILTERQAELYKAKGYPDEWIKERLQNIDTRKRLTEEWKKRGVKEGQEYSILTATISEGTFGIKPTEHKEIKGLTKPSQNLRDHMTELELILTSLGEAVTRTVTIDNNAHGFDQNRQAAIKGGKTAGEARERVEAATGKKVVSAENFLPLPKDKNKELPPSDDTPTLF